MSKYKYLTKQINLILEKYPDFNNKEVARILIEKNDTLKKYKLNTVRRIVGRIKKEESLANFTSFYSGGTSYTFINPSITHSNKTKFTDNKTVGLHLVTGCWHIPFHNKELVNGLYSLIKKLDTKLVGFHLIGDFLDLNSLSSHDTNKFTALPGLNLNKEYEEGNKVLDKLDSILPDNIIKNYLYGNHEDRYFKYVSNMQNSKVPPVDPQIALKLKDRGYNTYPNWSNDFITLGSHLDLMHGHYYNVHSAKKHMDVFRGSVMYCHTHRIQTYIEGNTGSFNIGFLGDKNHKAFNYAARATKNSWQNGFALVHIDEEGDYSVQQIICNKNKFYYNGEECN